MALRNIKIVRDIVQTCNRYFSKSDVTALPTPKELSENKQENLTRNEFRYKVSKGSKSIVIPKFDFLAKEPERQLLSEMPHLQPAKQSKCVEVNINSKFESVWEPRTDNTYRDFAIECPFPEPIIEPQSNTVMFSEKTKHKPPTLGVAWEKGRKFHTLARHYSTLPFYQCRHNHTIKKNPKELKCKKTKKKCLKNQACPNFMLKGCPETKGSDCQHLYKAQRCEKKMAPYPSYSESCAQRLEDDPSECFQCPWQKCGGVEAIKIPKGPQKSYHTSTRPLNMAMIPTMNSAAILTRKECDAKKAPCKAPPPKCHKEEKKKQKCPDQKKDRRRKCDNGYMPEYGLWCDKEHVIPVENWPILEEIAEEPDLQKNVAYELKDPSCPEPPGKCPRKDKPSCPKVDKSIDVNIELKKHDEGHPPPCKEEKKPSQQCPKEKEKMPWKQQRDLDEPRYRNNPKPYGEHDYKT